MILQERIPYDATPRPLPGIAPLSLDDWLMIDDAYAGQMAERQRLITTQRPEVIATTPGCRAALQELYQFVLSQLPNLGFTCAEGQITRPDGAMITPDPTDPLATLGQLIQEDLCVLQKPAGAEEHVLSAALLCFPASWRLAEKIGRPLLAIHTPVASYDENIARRVQRLFDGIQPDRPLWRHNALWYADPTLHQPRASSNPRPHGGRDTHPYLRSERQCLLRLPDTRAVVFSIHTFVTRPEGPDQISSDSP